MGKNREGKEEGKEKGQKKITKFKIGLYGFCLCFFFFKVNITFLKTRMYHLLVPQGLQIFYQFLFQLGNSCSATYSENNDKISYYTLQKKEHCNFHF